MLLNRAVPYLLVSALWVAVTAAPAGATAACTFDPATGTVSVTLGADGDAANVRRFGTAIRVNAVACGDATVNNTDLILVRDLSDGNTTLRISMTAGAFLPGLTDEPGNSDEIEFDVDLGSGSGDQLVVEAGNWNNAVTFGAAGGNLNAAEFQGSDVDVVLAGVEAITVDGMGGDDVLSAAGGQATGDPAGWPTTLLGGDGADRLTGGAADDTLEGGAGPDILDGGPGADTERGGEGDDLFDQGEVPNGPDRMEGGDGSDTVRYRRSTVAALSADEIANDGEGADCSTTGLPTGPDCEGDNIAADVEVLDAGEPLPKEQDPITVNGTAGDDVLECTVPCTVNAGAGNDQVTCHAVCTVFGGPGNDTIIGSPGNDKLHGESGADVLNGGLGADLLDGGDGWDTADYGDRTEDLTITVGSGANDGASGEGDDVKGNVEKIVGGSGNDSIIGDGSGELLMGGGGNDLLRGGEGDDELRGGPGNDVLEGGPGDELMDGGPGNDTEDGEGGNDLFIQFEQQVFEWGGGQKKLNDRWATNTQMAVTGTPSVALDVNVRVDIEHPNPQHLLIRVRAPDGTPVKLAEYESNPGSYRGTVFDSEAFRNIKTANADLDGRFHPNGSLEPYRGRSAEGVWTLEIVDSTAGSVGFLNHFSLQVTFAGDPANGDDVLRGGTGNHDLIDYTGRSQDVTMTMQGGADDGQAGESDNVGGGDGDIEDAYGGAGNDTIFGTAGPNDLRGLQGADQIYGLGGADILRGLVGADLLDGGEGNDVIFAGLGNDHIVGGPGIDWARFTAGPLNLNLTTGTSTGEGNDTLAEIENVLSPATNDTLVGDGSNNILSGGGGNDILSGEGGNDTLIGGAGADQLEGGPGFDWTNYASAPSGVTVDLTAGTSSGGHGPDTLIDMEYVRGSRFADTITGNELANLLEGAEGNDTIYGLGGNDKLNGGPGTDTLNGGPGTDTCLEGEFLTDCE